MPLIELSENVFGLEKPANSLIKAIAAGIGGLAEPWQRRRLAKADISVFEQWNAALKAQGLDASKADLEVGQRASIRLVADATRHQSNREAIAFHSVDAFAELPSEYVISDNEIESEWIEQFWRYAELVENADLQQIWGRILAGKAAGSRPVSPRTLQFLSTLTRDEARAIEEIAAVAVGSKIGGLQEYALINSMSYFGDQPTQTMGQENEYARAMEPRLSELTQSGKWADLAAIGVLAQSGWAHEAHFDIPEHKCIWITIGGGEYSIVDESGLSSVWTRPYLSFGSGTRVSRLGSELLTIVSISPNREYVDIVAEVLKSHGLKLLQGRVLL